MIKYDTSTFQYGYELELSDVERVDLPSHLGTWDGCERDIVNTRPPHRGIAADPLGLEPPFGGEINTIPTVGWKGQVEKIEEILDFFRKLGNEPCIGPTAHGHIHVHIPGMCEDIKALKQLACYVFDNQRDVIETCGKYRWEHDMDRAAQAYFRMDGGRKLPSYILNNILDHATDLESFTKMFCMSKDMKRAGRPFRYAINMYCLKHTRTVEFRMFRGTLNVDLIRNSFRAVEAFMDAALNNPRRRFLEWQLLNNREQQYAPMLWDLELWEGLQATKYPETRGKKSRQHVEIK